MNITCNVIADILELYSDNVVSEDTRELVEAHLSDCADCREKLAGIKQSVTIPAETNAEPIKKIKRKFKLTHIRFVAYGLVIFIMLFMIFTVGVHNIFYRDDRTQPVIPFEKAGIQKVEEAGDNIHVYLSPNYGGATRFKYNTNELTVEIHFCSFKIKSNYESPYLSYSRYELEYFEVVAIYYCTVADCRRMGGNECDYSDTHLLWEI
jgi:hypothetical protein